MTDGFIRRRDLRGTVKALTKERDELLSLLTRWAAEMDEDGGYVPYFVRNALANTGKDQT